MTEEQFKELEDRIYALENRLVYKLEPKIEDLKYLCSRLEDEINEIKWKIWVS